MRGRRGSRQSIQRIALRDNVEGSGGGNTPEFASSVAAARGFQQVAKFFDVLSAERGADDTMILAHPDLERWPTTIESQSSITDFLRMVGASVAHFARRTYGTTVRVRSLPVPPS